MSEQNWGCLDKMSEVNFSPADTLFDKAQEPIVVAALARFFSHFLVHLAYIANAKKSVKSKIMSQF